MEFVAGQSMEQWTKEVDRTPEAFRRRLLVAQQLAEAMKAQGRYARMLDG
jgi:hypothetical protein